MKRKQPKDVRVKVKLLQEVSVQESINLSIEGTDCKENSCGNILKKSEKNYITERYQSVQSSATGRDEKCCRVKIEKDRQRYLMQTNVLKVSEKGIKNPVE